MRKRKRRYKIYLTFHCNFIKFVNFSIDRVSENISFGFSSYPVPLIVRAPGNTRNRLSIKH